MRIVYIAFFALICLVSCGMNIDTVTHTSDFTITSAAPLSEAIEDIESGSDGRTDFPDGIYVLINQTDFNTFYFNLFSHKAAIPPAPTVDFGSYMVIAYIDIQHDTVEYGVEILSVINDTGNNYTVTVQFTEPDGGAFQLITKPFHIIKIPLL